MSIETVGNLFQVLMPVHMYIYDGDRWIEVFSDSEQTLGTNQGVAVYMNAPLTVSLVGLPLPTAFSLQRGLTFVGTPRQSSDLPKVSDFLTFYPKICVVFLTSEGELYLVGRAGDSGDTKITEGQAFGIVSLSQHLTGFYGESWGTKQLELVFTSSSSDFVPYTHIIHFPRFDNSPISFVGNNDRCSLHTEVPNYR